MIQDLQKFIRYGAVGAVATTVHYLILIFWVEVLYGTPWVGTLFGGVLGAQVAFFGNRYLTFAHTGPLRPAWLKFHGTAALNVMIGTIVVATGVRCGWHYITSQVIATLICLGIGFAINRLWTFSPAEAAPDTVIDESPRWNGRKAATAGPDEDD